MEAKTKTKIRKTEFRIVEIDESQGWNQDILRACGGKITTVYLFDAAQTTCLCEYTPSYYLIPLYCNTSISFDEIKPEMQDNFQHGEMNCEPTYVHCHSIDKSHIKPHVRCFDGQYSSIDGRKYKELVDTAFEYLRANHQV